MLPAGGPPGGSERLTGGSLSAAWQVSSQLPDEPLQNLPDFSWTVRLGFGSSGPTEAGHLAAAGSAPCARDSDAVKSQSPGLDGSESFWPELRTHFPYGRISLCFQTSSI